MHPCGRTETINDCSNTAVARSVDASRTRTHGPEPWPVPCERRYRHLCVTRDCLSAWERQGYNATDVAEHLNATRASADHPNFAQDLRIQSGIHYR